MPRFSPIVSLLALCLGCFVAFAPAQQRTPDAPEILYAAHETPTVLDNVVDTLVIDDNRPYYAFRYPDAWGDNYRNQRFTAPGLCRLLGLQIAFLTRGGATWTTGNPDLVVLVWASGPDSLPIANEVLCTDTLPYANWNAQIYDLDSAWNGQARQFVYVDLSGFDLAFDSASAFHIGYSAVLNSSDDTLSILADDGYPTSSTTSEFFNGAFVRMSEGWPGVNFFIRAIVDVEGLGTTLLPPTGAVDALEMPVVYPNPFNATSSISFTLAAPGQVRVQVFDVLGRLHATLLNSRFEAGRHHAVLDGRGWSSGVYMVRLETPAGMRQVRAVLAK